MLVLFKTFLSPVFISGVITATRHIQCQVEQKSTPHKTFLSLYKYLHLRLKCIHRLRRLNQVSIVERCSLLTVVGRNKIYVVCCWLDGDLSDFILDSMWVAPFFFGSPLPLSYRYLGLQLSDRASTGRKVKDCPWCSQFHFKQLNYV